MARIPDSVGRRDWELTGQVKTCRIQRLWRMDDEHDDVSLLEFRRDGLCERHWRRDRQGEEWTTIYEYDLTSRLSMVRATGPRGWAQTRIHEYDAGERLRRVITRDSDGRDRVTDTFTYQGDRRSTHTRHLDPRACDASYLGVEGTDARFAATGVTTITTMYDPQERPVVTSFIDGTGRIATQVNLRHDDAGRLVEEVSVSGDASVPGESRVPPRGEELSRRQFRYDDLGRLREIIVPFGALGRRLQLIDYNEHGDEHLVESLDEAREYENAPDDLPCSTSLSLDDLASSVLTRVDVHRSWSRFRYRYDRQDNWVERLIEGRTEPDPQWIADGVTYRTLTYFDY
jgi:hypothetical protein